MVLVRSTNIKQNFSITLNYSFKAKRLSVILLLYILTSYIYSNIINRL